jgi:hypothetical protein
MKRVVQPELLDELPANNPRAEKSRRDLRRVNWLMGNVGIIQQNLEKYFAGKPLEKIVELGAGDGSFMLQIAQRNSKRWRNIEATFVDQQRLISVETENGFRKLGWEIKIIRADIFDWLPACAPADCIVTNLFLHHFENEKLSELLHLISEKTKVFIACEPWRCRWSVPGTKLLWLLGCNDVTRHDAAVSVRAGFREKEISNLWPQNEKWKTEEGESGLFSHTFSAKKI